MAEARVLIIGGGAAGLCAAIAAARLGTAVTVLEMDTRVGRKILASGNGRCNLTNTSISPLAYNLPEFVEPVLGRYPYEGVRLFFNALGLLTSPDDEGRVYPVSNTAGSVLDVLRLECAHLGVDVRCGFEAARISQELGSARLEVYSRDGEQDRGEAVVVTTGGGGSLLSDTGHAMVDRTPVLGPLRTETEPIRGLSGVRVKCTASLIVDGKADGLGGDPIATESGELLFRDYGVSGIMVFDLSRYVVEECVLSIDLLPRFSARELQELIEQRCSALPWRSAETFFAGMLHDRLARAVLRTAGVGAHTPVSALPPSGLTALLKNFRLKVLGIGDARQAQVTRGGASTADFDPVTMASLRFGGLFAAGEVLDVDGRSGGFNLHWAWASGIVAGEAAARAALARASGPDANAAGPG